MTDFTLSIATSLKLKPEQVRATIALLDSGSTVPFIARYRKEQTSSLDEDQIRAVQEALNRERALADRRDAVLRSIEAQGQLTPVLQERIFAASTLTELEDLYLPFRPRRRTRASIARERGLEALAQQIIAQPTGTDSPEVIAASFVNDEVPTPSDALAGARDIVAELAADHPDVRGTVRQRTLRFGTISSSRIEDSDDPRGVYQTYYDFNHRVLSIQPYQVLALNRGEADKVLRIRVDVPDRDWQQTLQQHFPVDARSPLADQLTIALGDSARRLLLPAIERDVRRTLTEIAEKHAIQVFARNLRGLLSQPPLGQRVVMGIDPAYRTGCKVAVIDTTGRVLQTNTIYPHAPQNNWNAALVALQGMIDEHQVQVIAVGNGTASRETEQLVAELTRSGEGPHYLIVSEAGASVYSASPLARDELPDLDVTLRGAVSIARRVQDPLAELVKIDPKAIGVGLYQHDVDQKALGAALETVVVSVVNNVGVDLNTASPALLHYVSGIGGKLAAQIVAHREKIGRFASRKNLKDVSGLGPKAFEQAAGFLRVRDGDEPLDASAIHPESYRVARQLLKQAALKPLAQSDERERAIKDLLRRQTLPALADELGTGIPTLQDIVEQLIRPGRDPREDLPAPLLRSDVLSMADLQTGMILSGTVRNVVDFGAFIDIGVKQDGLLHRSQIPQDANPVVGDVIEVVILKVDLERGRIGLGLPEADKK